MYDELTFVVNLQNIQTFQKKGSTTLGLEGGHKPKISLTHACIFLFLFADAGGWGGDRSPLPLESTYDLLCITLYLQCIVILVTTYLLVNQSHSVVTTRCLTINHTHG